MFVYHLFVHLQHLLYNSSWIMSISTAINVANEQTNNALLREEKAAGRFIDSTALDSS